MAEFDPFNDAPLAVGERVRITHAYRIGIELKGWERHITGRCGTVEEVQVRYDAAWPTRRTPDDPAPDKRADLHVFVTVRLDPLKPNQRVAHRVSLTLASPYQPRCLDRIERLPAEPALVQCLHCGYRHRPADRQPLQPDAPDWQVSVCPRCGGQDIRLVEEVRHG
ncbi:hypothetical protein [Plasticicumulans sp.]|uniref:hypothetical protein n=1 Tax=Plasticicumulans sp. TaxID=2307179 RepID=UPI0032203D4D